MNDNFENCKNNIGNIPLADYIHYLSEHRYFHKDKIVSYTDEVYKVDISEYMENPEYYLWDKNEDIFSEFTDKFPFNEDDGSRDYFERYAKRKYSKFVNTYFINRFDKDCLFQYLKTSDVHHIHPLAYSYNNQLENLIHLSGFCHDLLHCNPLEKQKNACYMAVDYLGNLCTFNGLNKIVNENSVFRDCEIEMAMGFIQVIIKNEMNKYYNKLELHFDSEVLVCP